MSKKSLKQSSKLAVKKLVVKKPILKKEVATTQKIPQIREGTKMFKLVEIIKASEGITLKEISESLKWQPHTTRSALSRLNKNFNVGIISDNSQGNSHIYKIAKKD